MKKTKIIRITTVPISFEKLLENQAKYFKNYFNIIIVSSQKDKLVEIGKQPSVKAPKMHINLLQYFIKTRNLQQALL